MNQCRICFEDDQNINMISPCLCCGSRLYVHARCHKRWISIDIENPRIECEICKSKFTNEWKVEQSDMNMLIIEFQLLIILEITSLLTCIFGVAFIYILYMEETGDRIGTTFGMYFKLATATVLNILAMFGLFDLIVNSWCKKTCLQYYATFVREQFGTLMFVLFCISFSLFRSLEYIYFANRSYFLGRVNTLTYST